MGLKSRRGVAIPRWCLGINETLERPAPSYRRVLFVVDKNGIIACPSSMKLPTSPTRLTLGDVHYFDPLFFFVASFALPLPSG